MNKETLKQYRNLIFEIKRLENQISKLESKIEHDKVSASNSEFPYQPITVHIEGVATPDIERLKKILEARRSKASRQRLKIESWINEIDDCRLRLIFQMRYIEDKKWVYISRQLGSCNESYARMAHDRYLEKYNSKK